MDPYRVVSSERTHLFSELHFLFAGEEHCESGYRFGPAVRPNYIIHYVVSGKGYYEFNGQIYKLSAQQAFVIFPNKSSVYWADKEEPWHYVWIGFTGLKSEDYVNEVGISMAYPVINFKEDNRCRDLIYNVLNRHKTSVSDYFFFQSVLYDFLHEIQQNRHSIVGVNEMPEYSKYTHQSLQYIENNYSQPFTITEMAESLYVNRSYLSRIFKQEVGVTLKEYINNFRITRARELLVITDHSYTEIAQLVGYESYNSFYKVFKQKTGDTPSVYRENLATIKRV
ncbi:AraC family transcriptional regulator [Staphylococcus simulans]|uniref:AraC family transcriptional regulator n=1 Tax=Staphylococcus simulans TaxID=1286 RepID=UPI0021CF5406|nr:AraC family transcriptional regulator [Staphylococcus simulans]UXR37938.1 AraC family transcriptional regulator [Staphylococcus simulans]